MKQRKEEWKGEEGIENIALTSNLFYFILFSDKLN